MAALRQKKAHEDELLRLSGTRATLETQVNAIESANLNAETMLAMKKGAEALKGIHSNPYVLLVLVRLILCAICRSGRGNLIIIMRWESGGASR